MRSAGPFFSHRCDEQRTFRGSSSGERRSPCGGERKAFGTLTYLVYAAGVALRVLLEHRLDRKTTLLGEVDDHGSSQLTGTKTSIFPAVDCADGNAKLVCQFLLRELELATQGAYQLTHLVHHGEIPPVPSGSCCCCTHTGFIFSKSGANAD